MKRLFIILTVLIIGCSKKNDFIAIEPIPKIEPVQKIDSVQKLEKLKKLSYFGKTSYELRKAQKYVDIDSIRQKLGVRNVGRNNGNGQLGWVYVDMNNDGREDIFYPLMAADSNKKEKPMVFINTPDGYLNDNSMLPNDYEGALDTRKSVVCDFNNDSLPDIFLSNSGYDGVTYFMNAKPALFINQKGKFFLKSLPNEVLYGGGFHGAAAGDINNDKNADLVLVGWGKVRVLYGNGDGSFRHQYIDIKDDQAFLTCEIVDVDKNGMNDIILAGNEMHSKSRIIWDGNFNNFSYICDYVPKWGTIMDIVVEDLDDDGINEIILNRTGDENGLRYCGYWFTTYKMNGKSFFDFTDKFFNEPKAQFFLENNVPAGGWVSHMIVDKLEDGSRIMYVDEKRREDVFWVKYLQDRVSKKFF